MQTENLDSGTNCTSSDKDKITSINITHDLFIPVNNLTHKVMTKTRKKEGKTGKKRNQKMQIQNFQIWESDNIQKQGYFRKEIVVYQKLTVIQLRRSYTNSLA